MLNPNEPPVWQTTRWFNSPAPLSLAGLNGKVVVAIAFQMLCPGCVSHGLPQGQRIRERFSEDEVAVVGLHTVFEHHAAMTEAALAAFIKEYRWSFPIGIDAPNGNGMPQTMKAYELQGTPSLLIFDRKGRLRRHYFGRADDLMLGAEIMALVAEGDQEAAMERKLTSALVMPGHDHHDHHHHHHHHGEGQGGCGDAGCGCH
ncbi:MAG: TlpA family protein disulfide reductase [Hyphomicrobiaceae bacterium]